MQFLIHKNTSILVLLVIIFLILTSVIVYQFYPLSKSHNVLSFNKDKVRILQKGDLLHGKTIPSTYLRLIFTPGNTKAEVESDAKGVWNYQIPSTIADGKYRLTVAGEDSTNSLAFIKSYKVRIISNREIYKLQKKIKLPNFLNKK